VNGHQAVLAGWADPAAVDGAAGEIRAKGAAFKQSVDALSSTWKGLDGCYQAPERADVLVAFDPITAQAELLEAATEAVSSALSDFAEGVRGLLPAKEALLTDLAAYQTEPEPVNSDDEPAAEAFHFARGESLQSRLTYLSGRYEQLETECAAALRSVDGYEGGALAFLAGPLFAAVVGTVQEFGDRHTARTRVTVDALELPAWAAPFYRDGERISVLDPRHPDYGSTRRFWYTTNVVETVREWRPTLNRTMYNQDETYRRRVDANPNRWAVPESIKWADQPGSLKLIKGVGWAGALAMTGVTYGDNLRQNRNELLRADPGMDAERLEGRAREMATVQTAASTGVDFAAGVTGAMIGTAIGGPLGTAVGFGVGMGISVITDLDLFDGRSIKDFTADIAVQGWDTTKELAVQGWDTATELAGSAAEEAEAAAEAIAEGTVAAAEAIAEGTEAAAEAIAAGWNRLWGN